MRIKIRELQPNDVIDLESDPYASDDPEMDRWRFEYAVVDTVEVETEDCIAVGGEGFWIGFPPDHEVTKVGTFDPATATIAYLKRQPDEIMADFDRAVRGEQDIDPHKVLWEVIEDVIDNMKLAMKGMDPERVDEIVSTVKDYAANHYDA